MFAKDCIFVHGNAAERARKSRKEGDRKKTIFTLNN
jgi:hypothetical protein